MSTGTVRLTDPLNDRQLQVLRWIADGCPDGVMTGHTYKLTARALHDRRLVEVSKRGGTWSAAVTDIGSYYLKHGSYPSEGELPMKQPVASPRPRPTSTKPKRAEDKPSAKEGQRSASEPRKLSATEQLVADVIAAGGVLKVPKDTSDAGWGRATELTRNANRHGKVPPGQRLEHDIVQEGEHWNGPSFDLFTLVEGPAGTDAPLVPVPVPEEVARYHHAVSALRKSKRLQMATSVQTRALRLLHAVAVEAEHRGFTVTTYVPKQNADHRRRSVDWHLLLAVGDEIVPLRISEETDRVEHVPTAHELKERERYSWTRIPTHDRVASGRLRIDIGGATQLERKAFWADRASWSLEEKLPEVLHEVAVRADELRLRREAKARAEAEHRQAVEREEQRAQRRAAEAHRVKVLENHLDRWRASQELREYIAAMAERIAAAEAEGQSDSDALAEARRWLTWITERADRHDPLTKLPTWPAAPKLHAYELREFMKHVPEPREMWYKPETY